MLYPFNDQVRWNRQRVDDEKRWVAGELTEAHAKGGLDAVRTYLLQGLQDLESNLAPEAQLRRFIFVVTLLGLHEAHGLLQATDVGRLVELGETILRVQGIEAGSSKLSFLYGELQQVVSQIRRKEGRHWKAAWQAQLGHALAKGSAEGAGGHQALTTAIRALRQGNALLAVQGFSVAASLEGTLEPAALEQARIGRVQALRLSGRLVEAEAALKRLLAEPGLGNEARLELEWEDMCRAVQQGGDLAKLIAATGRGRRHRGATYLLESTVWAKTASSKSWLTRVPKAESIRRAFPDALRRPAHNAFFYECALQLDRCYDNDVPLPTRLRDLGEVLEQSHRLVTIDKELLVWAASARWLMRYHQYMLAALALDEYRGLSLRLSDGLLPDVLGATADLDVKAWFRYEEAGRMAAYTEQDSLEKIKTSRLGRATDVGRLTLGVAGAVLKRKIKSIGKDEDERERIRVEESEEIAAHITRIIGRMKGPYVKVAQVLAFVAPRLPEPVRDAVSAMRETTTPVAAAVARGLVEAELGRPVSELFASFSDQPISAASVGQIHRATLKDGREVVVKVQYPGMRAAIESDFGLFAIFKPLLRRKFARLNIEELMDLSAKQLLEELDYKREARFQEAMRLALAGDPEVFVPAVIESHSSSGVLTMEYVRGRRFSEFLSTSTQAEKDRAGLAIYRTAWTGVLRHGIVHGDAHPGNFLFLDDGRVACIDYGYADNFRPERRDVWRCFMRSLLEDDFAAFERVLPRFGYAAEGVTLDSKAMWEKVKIASVALTSAEPYRFSNARIASNVERMTIQSSQRHEMRMEPEDWKLLRYVLCLQSVLATLEAEAVWSSAVKPLIYDAPGEPPERATG